MTRKTRTKQADTTEERFEELRRKLDERTPEPEGGWLWFCKRCGSGDLTKYEAVWVNGSVDHSRELADPAMGADWDVDEGCIFVDGIPAEFQCNACGAKGGGEIITGRFQISTELVAPRGSD